MCFYYIVSYKKVIYQIKVDFPSHFRLCYLLQSRMNFIISFTDVNHKARQARDIPLPPV